LNQDSVKQRIGVSGIGLVTPLGSTREKTWARLLAGESAILKSAIGLEARVYDFSLNGARSRMGDFALLAAAEAMAHAGFTRHDLQSKVVGTVVSQSKPIVDELSPELLIASFTGWSADAVVRREFKLSGPSTNVVAACATGVAALALGCRWLDAGDCDVALVGASESSLNAFYRAGFMQMGVLAEGNPSAVKPFDRARQGFAMGEGAAVFILEKEADLFARGHKPLVWIEQTVLMHNPADSVRVDEEGKLIERLIAKTVGENNLDYINAHGTATVMNDRAEARGITRWSNATGQKVLVSSTKAATGHLLGAAGAIEAAIAALSIRDGKIPPTLNFENPDDNITLDFVANQVRIKKIATALSLSYGFGGQMGGVLFKAIS
jgi:3-oxoacyl-[acyl-carrier-protein] synthase II